MQQIANLPLDQIFCDYDKTAAAIIDAHKKGNTGDCHKNLIVDLFANIPPNIKIKLNDGCVLEIFERLKDDLTRKLVESYGNSINQNALKIFVGNFSRAMSSGDLIKDILERSGDRAFWLIYDNAAAVGKPLVLKISFNSAAEAEKKARQLRRTYENDVLVNVKEATANGIKYPHCLVVTFDVTADPNCLVDVRKEFMEEVVSSLRQPSIDSGIS